MKIGEQALYLAQLKGLSKSEATKKIKAWFYRLDMESWWNKKVEDLSKGMSQKLQFVTTVLHEPKLIILDEPFSGLDPVNANLIKDEIYNLAKNGATIIFSTHRMEQVEEICDHIALVNKGQKILDGTVQNVKHDFKENLFKVKFTDKLLAEHLAIHLFEVKQKSDKEVIIKLDPGYTNNDVLQYFINKGLGIESFNEILPSLNEIFIRLVEGYANCTAVPGSNSIKDTRCKGQGTRHEHTLPIQLQIMNKILLIIQREYLTRVRKKTFIISTILFPILYLGLIFGMGYLGEKSKPRLHVAIVDSSGYFDKGRIERENQKDSSSVLTIVNSNTDSLKNNFTDWGYDGYIVIPPPTNWEAGIKNLLLHSSRTMGVEASRKSRE